MIYQLGDKVPVLPGENYYVADSAQVIGAVILEKDVSIWFGAVLRGDNEPIRLGSETNIQDGAILHTDPGYPLSLGTGVTVGHRAMLHGCEVGDYALIGIGAVVLNGAKIGRYSIIGAGAVVTENQVVPEGSLVVGAPAKVKKQLSSEQMKRLEASSAVYVANYKRYRSSLKALK